MRIVTGLAAAAALLIGHSVHAAERNLQRILACADEAQEARRLACYDREVAGIKDSEIAASRPPASEPNAARSAPPSPPPAATGGAQDSFGVSGSEVARKRRIEEEQSTSQAKVSSLTAKVTAVSSRPRGELVLTLDNGQVWAQKKPEAYFPAAVGDAVTINAGALGSYRLVNGNRSTQVTRVK
jgi:hypothetical protein